MILVESLRELPQMRVVWAPIQLDWGLGFRVLLGALITGIGLWHTTVLRLS